MQLKLEQQLQHDMDQIREKVAEMSKLVDIAISSCSKLFKKKNKQLAYSIIISDQNIDQLELELDKLCQAFLIRHQPVASILRFIYATIKINNELERIGDYAEGIARHYLNMCDIEPQPSFEQINQIAQKSLPMYRDAVKAFINNDCKLANQTMKNEDVVDEIRFKAESDLIGRHKSGDLPTEVFSQMITITSRFERIADRACNICEEVLYMCTGEQAKHDTSGPIKVLFIDKRDACRAQMATAIGNALGLKKYEFNSAGISPEEIDAKTIDFLKEKGYDISQKKSRNLNVITNLEDYDVLIALSKPATKVFPPPPAKNIQITWEIKDPSRLKGKKKDVEAAYEKTFEFIKEHITGLIFAINNQKLFEKEKRK